MFDSGLDECHCSAPPAGAGAILLENDAWETCLVAAHVNAFYSRSGCVGLPDDGCSRLNAGSQQPVITAAVQRLTSNPNPVRAHATPLIATKMASCRSRKWMSEGRGSARCTSPPRTVQLVPRRLYPIRAFKDCSVGAESPISTSECAGCHCDRTKLKDARHASGPDGAGPRD